ncbi:MAG TPA: LarC family nickel insertion protein, partial [Epulopiscium sp.]|nr:LarC family nickel insertion protein [Candidatus Epulonipiscium sp.]
MRTLYLDCFAGISGDMALGAFLDLGVKQETLLQGLEKLKADGYRIEISKKDKNGIMGTDVNVILEDDHHHHDHEAHDHEHHGHEHTHSDYDHGDHSHDHDRNLHSIEKLI